jgi:hypothetical protein
MSFGNVPADMLAGAVEKLLAKMDETDLAAFYQRQLPAMPSEAFHAFVEAMFSAFRERGESSEDAAEGAGTSLDSITRRDVRSSQSLLAYALKNPGVIKESTAHFIERRPDLTTLLPAAIRDALAERLTHTAS